MTPTITTVDEAARLGFAIGAFLDRPALHPLITSLPDDVLREKLRTSLQYLSTVGLLDRGETARLQLFVTDGTLPTIPSGPELLSVNSVLVSTVLWLNEVGVSLFGTVLAALDHVVDAAIDGFVHAGPPAALCCSSIAAMQVLQGIKSVAAKLSLESLDGIKSGIKSSVGIKS